MSITTYSRLDIDKAAVLFVDHQSGLLSLVNDIAPDEFRNNVSALVSITNFFKLPTVLTSSMESGPNGPILPYIKDNLSPYAYVQRDGEINAWDNEKFRNAIYDLVKKEKRTQFILAGVVTEVCVGFVALSLLHEKQYNPLMKDIEVFVAVDASGTSSTLVRDAVWNRITKAGAQGAELMTWFGIACELRRNWHPEEDNHNVAMAGFAQLVADHSTQYTNVMSSYNAAKNIG
ncbi:isochorismatase family protein [Entomobacter blattae]|uniref:Putative hydrolase YcaC n=1 Tax=Entomobacter blattae TaxID=2762277 RepID=A0A7H1NTX1_9PROT|nr:isochorismatase family protein [Entomobacter blattae]QNT79231.1 putative hydrolase YcaC [Entomobacter blattae]